MPPSFEVLEQRLRGRSKDSEEAIQRRLAGGARRSRGVRRVRLSSCINDELTAAVDRLRAIVLAERARLHADAQTAASIVETF